MTKQINSVKQTSAETLKPCLPNLRYSAFIAAVYGKLNGEDKRNFACRDSIETFVLSLTRSS